MKLKLVTMTALVGFVAVSCSSSKSDNVVTTRPGPNVGSITEPKTRTATGVTDTEIKVSALGYKAAFGDSLVGAQARFKRENDAGGVFGRKIVLTDFNDDNQTPATDSSLATKIVEQDKPFAIVPVMTAAFPAADYLNNAGVPYVGWGIVPDWCNKTAGFSLNGCTDPAINSTVGNFGPQAAALFADGKIKDKTIALIGTDNASAKIATKSFGEVWTHNGAKVVTTRNTVPLAPTVVADFTPYAQQILQSNGGKGPDLAEFVLDTGTTVGLAKKLRELGYKGVILTFTLYDPRIAPLSNNIFNEITFAPWEQQNTPAVAQMLKDIAAVDPSATKSLPLAAGYWSADLFISLLKHAGKDLTREKFLAAANAGFKYDGQGGTSNLEFPADHTEVASAIAFVEGNGKNYTVTVPFAPTPMVPKREIKG